MVKILNYSLRESKKEKKSFVSLKLQGELSFVQSNETGRYYATSKTCSITSTFSEEEAKALLGKEIPGSIERVECKEYEYTIVDAGEVIFLTHRWEFVPDGAPKPLRVVSAVMAL
jgi:hypothetical protein